MSTTKTAKEKITQISGTLRNYRVYHRYLGLVLGVLVLTSSVTGIVLGWKKDVDLLQPPTQKGATTDLAQWISHAQMASIATAALDSAQGKPGNAIDRLEARPDKGMVKVLFAEGSWEVQLDGSTGKVLSVAQRHSDWIEKVHDGSIISDFFKLTMMNVLGLGLIILTLTGISLWFYPRRIRELKRG